MPRILISGASGLIGSALVTSLGSQGCEVTRLIRGAAKKSSDVRWDPMQSIPPELVSGFDAVIHLSGESVAGRWTAAKKARIRDSRVVSTKNLSEALSKSQNPPRRFLCASATGYYGRRGDEILTEESTLGTGFLPEVCREWEAASDSAASAGIRTANLRTGLVLSRDGGPLKPMLLPFRLGLGGRIGCGRQWWSWIHIEDFIAAVHHMLQHDSVNGPVNMVSPNPVTNAEFTRTLAKVLKRPAILPVPAFAARLALGELANEALLGSARVGPKKLVDGGFDYQFPHLGFALENLLRN
jgi:uncharacterized protein (TIGR01777 family)